MEIFVVNESSLDVWFDDLTIAFEGALIAQENHYDPWGLELAGIGKQGLDRFTFNAQSEKQQDLNGGKGYFYETDWRGYDPQLGRFHGYDLLASKYTGITPYHYAINNPISYNDPSGLDWYRDADGNEKWFENDPGEGWTFIKADLDEVVVEGKSEVNQANIIPYIPLVLNPVTSIPTLIINLPLIIKTTQDLIRNSNGKEKKEKKKKKLKPLRIDDNVSLISGGDGGNGGGNDSWWNGGEDDPLLMIQVDYYSYDLSIMTRQNRRKNNNRGGVQTHAIFVYTDNSGQAQYHYARSWRNKFGAGQHAERVGISDLTKMGIKLENIQEIYVELQPCNENTNCQNFLRRTFQGIKTILVTYSFPYTPQGKDDKVKAIQEDFEEEDDE